MLAADLDIEVVQRGLGLIVVRVDQRLEQVEEIIPRDPLGYIGLKRGPKISKKLCAPEWIFCAIMNSLSIGSCSSLNWTTTFSLCGSRTSVFAEASGAENRISKSVVLSPMNWA